MGQWLREPFAESNHTTTIQISEDKRLITTEKLEAAVRPAFQSPHCHTPNCHQSGYTFWSGIFLKSHSHDWLTPWRVQQSNRQAALHGKCKQSSRPKLVCLGACDHERWKSKNGRGMEATDKSNPLKERLWMQSISTTIWQTKSRSWLTQPNALPNKNFRSCRRPLITH